MDGWRTSYRSFTYVTEDEEWFKKILLGGLISLIPFVGQFYLMGYVLEVLRNVLNGREVPLPEVTEDFGAKLLSGLLLAVITFVYFLPLMVISVFLGIGASRITGLVENADQIGTVVAAWSGCFGCLSTGLLLPFAWSKYAESGEFAQAFKLGEIVGLLRENLGQAVIVMLISALAGMIAALAGMVLCVIGMIFTTFYAQLIGAYLYGALYRQARKPAL